MNEKFCKHCQVHHPITKEFWEFTKDGAPFRCKAYRRRKYLEEGKERAADYWKNLSPEQRAQKAARKRELRKEKATVDSPVQDA